MVHDADKHLVNAKNLLSSSNDDFVRYACLELRYCIEAIVYNKLERFKNKIPKNIIETWEPNKAMKMLLKIDELADKECSIAVNLSESESPPKNGWMMLGEQKIPSVTWINKNYNKLGYFLHLPEPAKSHINTPEKLRSNLNQLINDLDLYSNNSFWMNITQINMQNCRLCGEELLFSPSKMKIGNSVACASRKCKANYIFNLSNESGKCSLDYKTYDIRCQKCEKPIEIAEHLITQEGKFSCGDCGASYTVRTDYHYSLLG